MGPLLRKYLGRRPAACPRDPEQADDLQLSTLWAKSSGSRGQAAGRRKAKNDLCNNAQKGKYEVTI